jgi:choline dehydrogenase-like flavoprotein
MHPFVLMLCVSPSVKWLQYTAQAYGTSLDWQIYTVPQVKANNRVFRQTQGKVLGGMGALNGAIYVRPAKEEYTGLEQLGQTGW